jgi:aryl-alcohol dehydrogenase-like predicted oxidoreductase
MAAWEFQQLQTIAEKNNWHKFISMQGYHNLLYREEEREMIPYCNATGVGLIPWSPIARGALARPFGSRGTLREDTDQFLKSMIRSRETEIDERIINRVEELARKKGVSMASLATAWSLSKGFCPILGMNKKERVEEACQSLRVRLTEDEIKYLEEGYLPKPITGY